MAGRLVRLLVPVLLLVPGVSAGDHPGEGPETLVGVPAVMVAVDFLDAHLQDNAVSEGAVRRAVRSVLEDANIATGHAEEAARLHVRIESRRSSRRFLALAIDLELRQHVRLERDPERVFAATTWSNAAVSPLEIANSDAVPERVGRFVAHTFVRDFRAANSDQP